MWHEQLDDASDPGCVDFSDLVADIPGFDAAAAFACQSHAADHFGGMVIADRTVTLLDSREPAVLERAAVHRWELAVQGQTCTLTLRTHETYDTRMSAALAPVILEVCHRYFGCHRRETHRA